MDVTAIDCTQSLRKKFQFGILGNITWGVVIWCQLLDIFCVEWCMGKDLCYFLEVPILYQFELLYANNDKIIILWNSFIWSLKLLTKMVNSKACNGCIQKNSKLFFQWNIFGIIMSHITYLWDQCNKDMLWHSQFCLNTIRMPIKQLIDPALTCKDGCVMWLLHKMALDKLNKCRKNSCDYKSSDLKDLSVEILLGCALNLALLIHGRWQSCQCAFMSTIYCAYGCVHLILWIHLIFWVYPGHT